MRKAIAATSQLGQYLSPAVSAPHYNLLHPPIRVESLLVQWIVPVNSVKHGFVDLAVIPTKVAVEQVVWHCPAVDELDGMRSDLFRH